LYIQRVWKNMMNTSKLYFNCYESTNYTQSSASVSSGSSTILVPRGFA
jgi:hypothetical protein